MTQLRGLSRGVSAGVPAVWPRPAALGRLALTRGTSLWWALALGASANVVITGIAARQRHPISFWRYTRYGLVITAVTITLVWPYLWLRYFVLA